MPAVFEALAAPRRREILRLVWDRERSAGDIHRALDGVSFGAVSQHLRVLETAGLVRRTPDPEDRRGVRVCLTPKGRRLVDAVIESRFAAADETIACLTPKEARTTAAALRKLLFAAENAAGAAAR